MGSPEALSGIRSRAVDPTNQRIRLALLTGSKQEEDLTDPANCSGWGRLRHFPAEPDGLWPPNLLPALVAAKALECSSSDTSRTQLFQIAACNLRCWYCFVDRDLLDCAPERSRLVSPTDMVEQFMQTERPPKVVVLSGGNPGLAPEWALWTLRAMKNAGIADRVFLWSDDNLTVSLYSEVLMPRELDELSSHRGYGAVGCFKGFDVDSFAFNTGAASSLFGTQFEVFASLRSFLPNVYGYVTLTTPHLRNLHDRICDFVDRLQQVDANLPLRVMPLRIREDYAPTRKRMTPEREHAVHCLQHEVLAAWLAELANRFPSSLLELPIARVGWASRAVG